MTARSDFPPDVQALAKQAHAEFADSRNRDNLGVIIARTIMADRIRRVPVKALTARQADCLKFIASHQSENAGLTPTYDEIKNGLGLASKSGVNRLIDGLVERGAIQRLPNRARAITIIANPASQQEQA